MPCVLYTFLWACTGCLAFKFLHLEQRRWTCSPNSAPAPPVWPSAPIPPPEGGDMVSSPQRPLSALIEELGRTPPPASVTVGEVWGPPSLLCPGRGPLPQDPLLLPSPPWHGAWAVLWVQPEGLGTSLDPPVGRCLPGPVWTATTGSFSLQPSPGGSQRLVRIVTVDRTKASALCSSFDGTQSGKAGPRCWEGLQAAGLAQGAPPQREQDGS